jgi:hypothetical protein
MRTLRIRPVARQPRWLLLFGLFVAMIATALVGPGARPANADHNNPVALCGGSEYDNIRAEGSIINDNLEITGVVHLMQHVNSDTFCAVTIRWFHNEPRNTVVKIKRCAAGRHPGDPCNGDTSWKSDAGQFLEYAGPVYRSKGGGTIVARGQIGNHCMTIYFRGSSDATFDRGC